MENNVIASFSGACGPSKRGGHMGLGWVVDGEARSKCIPDAPGNSKNVAEHLALIEILQHAITHPEITNLKIIGDSRLFFHQLSRKYALRSIKSFPLFQQAKNLVGQLEKRGCRVQIDWVTLEHNAVADAASNAAIQPFKRPANSKSRKRLYRESLELEEYLRDSLPGYALEHLDAALNGDVEEATSLLYAATNSLRGDIALLFYLRGASPDLQKEVLGGAWETDHEEVRMTAGSRPRLRAMFKAMQFVPPSFIPDRVEVWRAIQVRELDIYRTSGISWTLKRDVALWFARRIEHFGGRAAVLSTVVARETILYYSDDREEAECVIFDIDFAEVTVFQMDAFGAEEGMKHPGSTDAPAD